MGGTRTGRVTAPARCFRPGQLHDLQPGVQPDTSGAKKAARQGPVFITDRGRPADVSRTIEEYQRLTGDRVDIIEMLGMPGVEHIEFEPPRLPGDIHRPVDLSLMNATSTNVVSELRKARAGKADAGVARWAAGVPVEPLSVGR